MNKKGKVIKILQILLGHVHVRVDVAYNFPNYTNADVFRFSRNKFIYPVSHWLIGNTWKYIHNIYNINIQSVWLITLVELAYI